MKKLFCLVTMIGLVAIASHAGNTPYPGLLWSVTTTNFNVILGPTGTNTSGAYTNNAQTGVVLGTSNNIFNLANSVGTQATTNFWPSVGMTLLTQYPNTYAPPANNLTLVTQCSLMATNATSTVLVFKYAASADGAIWATNYYQQAYTIPINSLGGFVAQTNITTGAMPFVALQEIDNPGANIVTNVVLEASAKSGL